MDAFTLHISTAIISAMMVVSLLTFYFVGNRERSLIDWSIAGGLFFFSNAVGISSYFFDIPYWLGPALTNACYILAHLALLAGLRRHLLLSPNWSLMLGIAAAVFLAHFIPGLLETITYRLLYIYPLLMAINVYTVITVVLGVKSKKLHAIYYPFMFAELIFLGQQLVRYIFVIFDNQLPLTTAGDHLLQTLGTLAVMTFLLLMMLSCCLIIYRQQQLKLFDAIEVDSLTGLLNRQALPQRAKEMFEQSTPSTPLAIMVVEIDDLPQLSEQYGYPASDSVIKHIANVLKFTTHIEGGIFRSQTNKFVLLIEGATVEQLIRLSERLIEKVANMQMKALPNGVQTNLNIGYSIQSAHDHSWQILFQQAEQKLKQTMAAEPAVESRHAKNITLDRFGFSA
ncbi:GGDEF domain-containing protein [Shewanella sp. ULN5]|uniref:GGDEF domain-containing protein n=1 Tax=Shewanella sp. ULN5 TaxID=2994678 RepID=UPI00273F7D87|nr:GGDEF domain-containing protein [Shewanella sp. ULN5]MDP5145778.1 GGDEF domain-containing protein [Shewanella sp. ULN5]